MTTKIFLHLRAGQRSRQDLKRLPSVSPCESVKLGQTIYARSGKNSKSWVHIDDLMVVYLRLVQAAANGGKGAQWDKQGYYFCSSQEATQHDVAIAAGKISKRHGVLQDETPRQCSLNEVNGMLGRYGIHGSGLYMYAANSRTKTDRAEKVLRYQPSAPSFWESMDADLLACKNDQQGR